MIRLPCLTGVVPLPAALAISGRLMTRNSSAIRDRWCPGVTNPCAASLARSRSRRDGTGMTLWRRFRRAARTDGVQLPGLAGNLRDLYLYTGAAELLEALGRLFNETHGRPSSEIRRQLFQRDEARQKSPDECPDASEETQSAPSRGPLHGLAHDHRDHSEKRKARRLAQGSPIVERRPDLIGKIGRPQFPRPTREPAPAERASDGLAAPGAETPWADR